MLPPNSTEKNGLDNMTYTNTHYSTFVAILWMQCKLKG